MQDEYDIKKIMEEIEQDLIVRMKRTLWSHKEDEKSKEFNWTQWQAIKLKQIQDYKQANAEVFESNTKGFNRYIYKHIKQQFKEGASKANKEALKAGVIKKEDAQLGGSFFGLNHRKLDALIKSTKTDLKGVKYATLRMANDQYRQIIYKAQVYANTGAGTVKQAIDMASKDFLAKGFNCIEYKDGSRHNIADYCDMAIRTANKRANLMGEGEMRKKLGNPLVYISKHSKACSKCANWQGRVYIDDVWSGGTEKNGKYPMLSTAIEGGLFHPRCQHGSHTYYEEINDEPEEVTEAEHSHDKKDQYTQYLQQRKKQYERLALGSLYPENIEKYKERANELQNQIDSNYIELSNQFKAQKEYKVKEQEYFVDDNKNKYVVDNKNVILRPTKREKEVANMLGALYGKNVNIIPRINEPAGIKTPDYIIDNQRFDLKEIMGNGKYVIQGNVKNKQKQADNFIIDITKSKLNEDDAIKQIINIYNSKHYLWLDKIILIKDKRILRIYKRK